MSGRVYSTSRDLLLLLLNFSFSDTSFLTKQTSINSIQLNWPYFFNPEIQLSYDEITHTWAQVASFCGPWSSFNSTRYLNENERYKTKNPNSFVNINSNTTAFVSITLHQKEPLGCVVYSHFSTNDSQNKCIHSCCLPCNYITKSFRILHWEIKSQKELTSFEHSKRQMLISFLSEKLFRLVFRFLGLMKMVII